MEAAGAIFLPTTGQLSYPGVNLTDIQSGQDNEMGFYWMTFDGAYHNFMMTNGNSIFSIQDNNVGAIPGSLNGWYFAIRPVRTSN